MNTNAEVLEILIKIYAIIVLINTLITGIFLLRTKEYLFKLSLLTWIFQFINFALQGAFQKNHTYMVLSFSIYFIVSILFSKILFAANSAKAPVKKYLYVMLASYIIFILQVLLNANFTYMALPIAIGIATPMLHSAFVHIKKYKTVSFETLFFSAFLVINAIHYLDYPFLRLNPETAIYGFSLAFILQIVLSIILPVFIVRKIDKTHQNYLQQQIAKTQKAQDEAISSKNEAIGLSKVKSNFLANMSHELRNPLNSISSSLELLDIEDNEYITYIRNATYKLNETVFNILDFTKLESGKIDIKNEKFSFQEYISSTKKYWSSIIEDKNLKFIINSDINHNYLNGDIHSIQRITNILISNALKFTDSGLIELRISEVMDKTNNSEKEATFNISVTDTGQGVSVEMEDQLFDIFQQSDNSEIRSHGGLGLGLSIAFLLLDNMNSKISFTRAKEGNGSIFSFSITLPIIEGIHLFKAKPYKVDWKNLKILIVEDDLVNQKLLKLLLLKLGTQDVKIANNGQEGLNMYRNSDYNLILMDIQMPLMSGIDCIEEIRKIELNTGKHVPIISITAKALHGDEEKIMEAGSDSYASKPIFKASLQQIVEETLKKFI